VVLNDLKEDLDRKRSILRVYINAYHIIHHAHALHQWERFRIIFGRVENLEKPFCETQPGTYLHGHITLEMDENQVKSCNPFPKKPFSSVIDFCHHQNVYYVDYNPFLMPDRNLQVSLSASQKGQMISIGTLKLPMSKLHVERTHSEETTEIVVENSSPNLIKPVKLKVRVKRMDSNKIKQYHRKLCILLSDTIYMIKCFNDDLGHTLKERSSIVRLDANIRGSDNISLLHAAIFLKDLSLFAVLLELGAKPTAKSKIGAPFSVVRHYMNMEADGRDQPQCSTQVTYPHDCKASLRSSHWTIDSKMLDTLLQSMKPSN
jgi:hypothetical protein